MKIYPLEFDHTPEWERLLESLEYSKLIKKHGIYAGLPIDFDFVLMNEPELALSILQDPETILGQGEALLSRKLLSKNKSPDGLFGFIRIHNLPENVHRPISSISVTDVDRIVSFNALVSLRAKQKQRILISCDQCSSCGFHIFTPANKGIIEGPYECSKDEGGCGKRIGSTKFVRVDHASTLIDTLKIELEDVQDHAFMGTPGKITAILEGDLITDPKKRIEAGDRVKITGIYRLRPNKQKDGFRKAEHDGYIDVLHIESDEKFTLDIISTDVEMFQEKRNEALLQIRKSLSPTIEGYNNIKLALTLSLFGGVSGYKVDGSYQRGEIHLLMVGDPSTAKSQIGDGTLRLAPRGSSLQEKALQE